jgi:membrane protease YdiL (CAAX protease family)
VIMVALVLATQLLSRFLPQSEENSFSELLRSSTRVRIAIAALATFTAPLVEETVYRGMLFSSFRRSLGLVGTVVLVTLMFAGVHVLQYMGAWVSVAGLVLLSLALTLIRARTKSILPCVLIHTVNNAFFSVLVLFNKVS